MRKLKILVLHSLGDPQKSPIFLQNHVFALRKYFPEHDYVYHDTTIDKPDSIIDVQFDAIVLDVTFLCARWSGPIQFETIKRNYAFVRDKKAVRLAFPQDDYDCSELLDDWMCDWNIDIVYSVIDKNLDVLYPRYSKIGQIRLAYTGYIDDSLLYFQPAPRYGRPIDIGYRARRLPPYFGRLGETKWRIGQYVNQLCRKTDLVTDIVLGDAGALNGKAWLDFINGCKFTLGANSGSSLLDPRGAIQKCVNDYLFAHPRALFEDVERTCFAGLDGLYEFTAISPRVLEAGILESCQILVEGFYSGILKPWEHYIPIKSDASNFEQVYDAIKDPVLSSRLVTACKSELLSTEALRYRSHAKGILDSIMELVDGSAGSGAMRSGSATGVAEASGPEIVSGSVGLSARRYDVLLLASHEPQRDPRLGWIAKGRSDKFIVHQLGVSRIESDSPRVSGSETDGWVWSYPRIDSHYDLSVIRELIFSRKESDAILELTGLIATVELSDRDLFAVLDRIEKPRIRMFRWYIRYILQMTFSLVSQAEKISGINAVIATDLDTLLAGILLKERWGVPLLYDAHEFWPAADVDQDVVEHDFWVALEGRLLKCVDYAQTVSSSLAAHMSKLYGRPFICVPNAEPLSSLIAEKDRNTSARLSGEECRFLFQGGFAPARGIDVLIQAWPKTANSAILVLRGPDSAFKQKMIRLSKSVGLLGSRILFPEPVDESQLVRAASECDVGLIPYTPCGVNYANCCPNKLSQYMAAGLPVLASKTNYVEEIMRESGAGLVVDFSNSEQLIKAIDAFALDKTKRAECANNSLTYFRESFHWEMVSKIFYARLFALVEQKGATSLRRFAITDQPAVFQKIGGGKDHLRRVLFRIARRVWHRFPMDLKHSLGPVLRRWIG